MRPVILLTLMAVIFLLAIDVDTHQRVKRLETRTQQLLALPEDHD